MPSDIILHACAIGGLKAIKGRWLANANQLRGTCDECNKAVYAASDGTEEHTVSLEKEVR